MKCMSCLSLSIALVVLVGCTAPETKESPKDGMTASAPSVLVPDAERAMDVLTNSPRHGEWIDITLADGSPLRSWIVFPERAEKAPVVIVIHEIFGLTDWVRSVADSLAADGFLAVAPDLLSGKGPGGGGTESFEGDAVRGAIRGLESDVVTARLNAVRAHALALPAASRNSATIGFCWGGRQSFQYATRQRALQAAVVYYGTAPKDPVELAKVSCPVAGFYGGDDARVTSTVEATTVAMRELGLTFDAFVFEGAGHGFLRRQSGRGGANQRAAEVSWNTTIRFLREHLE